MARHNGAERWRPDERCHLPKSGKIDTCKVAHEFVIILIIADIGFSYANTFVNYQQ